MTLFSSQLPKAPPTVRKAFSTIVERIRTTVETHDVYNTDAQNSYPRGTVVSLVEQVGASVDYPGQVAPTTDSLGLPPPELCKFQHAGVLEMDLPAATLAGPGFATARHDGGPVYVRLDNSLTLHVGDPLWATNDLLKRGLATNVTVSGAPIYVGTVKSIAGYNPSAPAGTTGCLAIVRHTAPPFAVP